MRPRLREPKPPYDDEPEEKTPEAPRTRHNRSERCRVCWGTGRIHLTRRGQDVGRARRCLACHGSGWVVVDKEEM